MPEADTQKAAVILLAMGGPDSVDDIPEFLVNIFSDREIIRLPGGKLLQKPFARLISRLRSKNVQKNYRAIGGGSPLLKWTTAQAENFRRELQKDTDVGVFVGMRYFRPMIKQAIDDAYAQGYRKMYFLPMYPQYCRATTGSTFAVVKQEIKRKDGIAAVFIDNFHDNEQYTGLLKKHIDDNIKDDEILLFSAHSIPQKFVDEGDPYVDQVKRTAALAAGDREYYLSFQSRTGPVKWVGPNTIDESVRLAGMDKRGLFVVPISFVCDHIETLHEIDINLAEIVKEKTGVTLRRMPMFNDSEEFGLMLAQLVSERVHVNAG